MKILIMVHALNGGGAERVSVSWANGLYELGHQVIMYTSLDNQTYYPNKNIQIIESKSILKCSNFFLSKICKKLFTPIIHFIQLFRVIQLIKPDVVLNVLYFDSYPLLLARFCSGQIFPIIMTDHNAYERPKEAKFKWRQWKHKFVDNRLFNLVTVLTKRDKKILNERGIRHVEVLHNPLFLGPVKAVPNKEKIIMAAGRLDAWYVKGFDVLLKAWNDVGKKYTDWKLIIFGDGSDNNKKILQSMISDEIGNVAILPFTDKIATEYKKSSIFVLSSRYEGWGLVAVEAMSQGCATIACDYKGRQAEFIQEKHNGLLCPVNDVSALKKCIEDLILDEKLRSQIQCNSIHGLAQYEEKFVAKQLEKIIKGCKK